ncbi:hypothetical protein GGI12_002276 [Dipsacomyces acuminosporus]|nr:hypothetical protein GGI12_002276 [Dipsacomyces acuminosporus]
MDFSAAQAFANWRYFLMVLALGQILSLCITGTSVLTGKLAEHQNVTLPNFQSFLVYVLLFIVYMPIALVRVGPRNMWLNIKKRFYWYILLGAVDVEGNFFVVKAYSYTSFLSCVLLDEWCLPCVVIISFFLMKVRYRWTQVLGVLMCLGGMGMLIKGDVDGGKNSYAAVDAVKGDIFMLIGATCYAVSNTVEEFIVRHRPRCETVAWLGFFGMIINGVQMAIIEHNTLKQLKWTKEVVGYTLGFDLVMFILYTLAPILFRLSSATFYNLSIMTSDFYGLIFGKYMFGDKITPIYGGAFTLIIVGLTVYHVFPHNVPTHMAAVYGFRTPVPGDIDQKPEGDGPAQDDGDAESSNGSDLGSQAGRKADTKIAKQLASDLNAQGVVRASDANHMA